MTGYPIHPDALQVYCVRHGDETDLEPRAGWYVSPRDDHEFPNGPFGSRTSAQDWAEHEQAKRGAL
jgi:hypothetical protein